MHDDREFFLLEHSISDWDQRYTFDLLFNDHFSRDVNLRTFNYKPYILNFLFGIFSTLKSTIPTYQTRLIHKFYIHETNCIGWLLVFDQLGGHHYRFVNFYLNDSFRRIESPISQQQFEAARYGSYFEPRTLGKITLNEYIIQPLLNTSDTLKLVVTKLQLRNCTLNQNSNSTTQLYTYMKIDDSLRHAARKFLFEPSGNTSHLFFNAAENVFNSMNQSFYRGKNPAAALGYIHGVLFTERNFYYPIVIRHHRKNNIDSFYMTINPSKPFTLSFLGNATNSNWIKNMSDHDLTCVDYETSYMLNYAYGLQKPEPCNLEKSSHFYLNGLDYLANMFEYSKYVTDEKLRTGEFVEYLTDIFERVRPTNIRYDETTANYLRFFVMGTFASSEEKSGYEAVVHIYENIFIFKPKDPLYLFVILTLNADYQRIAVEDFGNKDSGPIFLININESSSPNDALLSKKFLRRTIEAKLLSIDQIGKKRKVFSDGWAKLERSTFLDSLLTTKPDLENFLQLMENSMFKLLYDIDYRYSFHPFMHGLFYRSALSKLVHYEEVWFSKYMSRWTYTVQVYDQTNGWRNMFFYFLPSFEEIAQFINSVPPQKSMKGTKGLHVTFMYNQVSEKLETLILEAYHVSDMVREAGYWACTMFPSMEASLCRPTDEYPYGVSKNRYRLHPRKRYFSLSNIIISHIETFSQFNPKKDKKSDFNQVNFYEPNFRLRYKKVSSIKKIPDQYLLGFNLRKLNVDLSMAGQLDVGDRNNIIAVDALKFDGLTLHSLTTISLPLLLSVVNSYARYFNYLGQPSLGAISNALFSNLDNILATDIIRPLNDVIELLAWERDVERRTIKIHEQLQFSEYDNGSSYNSYILNMTKTKLQFPENGANISLYACHKNHDCSGIAIEFDEPYLDFKSTKFPAIERGMHIICREGILLPKSIFTIQDRNLNSSSSFFCRSIFAVYNYGFQNLTSDPRPYPTLVYKTGPQASMKSAPGYYNHFEIISGFFLLEGGHGDDIFDFTFSLQCGSISGGEGDDTLKLNEYVSADYELLISSHWVRFRLINESMEVNCVFIESIERIVGMPNRTETVFINCAFDMVALNGGLPKHPDTIHVPRDIYCPNVISFVIKDATVVRNMALYGRYLYKVSSLVQGDATIYLQGVENYIHHTIIIEYTSVGDLTSLSYNNDTITIIGKNSGILFVIVNGTLDSLEIIFKDGERLLYNKKSLSIRLNDADSSLTSLLDKYAHMNILENISLDIESAQLGQNLRITKNNIQYDDEDSIPFRFVRVTLDGSGSSIQCSSGETYVLVMPYYNMLQTKVTFVKSNSSQDNIRLIIDLTYHPITNVTFTKIANSDKFEMTGYQIFNNFYYVLFVLQFEGFGPYDWLKSVYILRKMKYAVKIKTSKKDPVDNFDIYSVESNSSIAKYDDIFLTYEKVPKIYKPVGNFVHFDPDDVDWNEELIFPTIYLTNCDVMTAGNHIILTSILSNIDQDVLKLSGSLFTIILGNFTIDPKMKSLTLKFGNGEKLYTRDLLKLRYISYADINAYTYTYLVVDMFLTRRESESEDYVGDFFTHEWREIMFGREKSRVKKQRDGNSTLVRR